MPEGRLALHVRRQGHHALRRPGNHAGLARHAGRHGPGLEPGRERWRRRGGFADGHAVPARRLGEHVGRSFGLGLSAPSIGSVASFRTVRRSHKSRAPLDPQPTRPARHDLRRVRVVEHHDRRAGHVATGVGQEVGWGLGHFF